MFYVRNVRASVCITIPMHTCCDLLSLKKMARWGCLNSARMNMLGFLSVAIVGIGRRKRKFSPLLAMTAAKLPNPNPAPYNKDGSPIEENHAAGCLNFGFSGLENAYRSS